jgi:hypothetical protein
MQQKTPISTISTSSTSSTSSTILLIFLTLVSRLVVAQCCGVGGGSPIASDISQSVLLKGQMELNANFQGISSDRFKTGNQIDKNYLKFFGSRYSYFRMAYGITKEFTFSVESGYWLRKMQIGLKDDTLLSSGLGDLILFPKVNLYKKNQTEITAGIGVKLSLGHYQDSTGFLEPFSGQTIYLKNPPAVQPSSGANDVIFNIFFAHSIPARRVRIFASGMYILKGWNPAGERFGDYSSLCLIAAYRIQKSLSAMVQVKGEWIGTMKLNPVIMQHNFPLYDPKATGSKKILLVPQVNYSPGKGFNLFISSEIPLYQYVNKTQIASRFQFTCGISYRFMLFTPPPPPTLTFTGIAAP